MLKDFETKKPVIRTQRLLLRNLVASDVDDLWELLGLPEIYEFLGRKASKGGERTRTDVSSVKGNQTT